MGFLYKRYDRCYGDTCSHIIMSCIGGEWKFTLKGFCQIWDFIVF